MAVDVACDSACMQDQSHHESAVPEGAIGGESGVDREGAEAARVFEADVERGGDGVGGGGGGCGEVRGSVDECGLEEAGGAGEEETAVIWLVGRV